MSATPSSPRSAAAASTVSGGAVVARPFTVVRSSAAKVRRHTDAATVHEFTTCELRGIESVTSSGRTFVRPCSHAAAVLSMTAPA
jgi:hypothetical protein